MYHKRDSLEHLVKELTGHLGVEGEFSICRTNGEPMHMGEIMMLGEIMAQIDTFIYPETQFPDPESKQSREEWVKEYQP